MKVEQIPYHLRNTVEYLDLPVFFELEGDDLRAPAGLALGDTLMLLGFLRNLGRPVRVHCATPYREVLMGHPLVRELVDPPDPLRRFAVGRLPVGRSGRGWTWFSDTRMRYRLPVLPVDQVRANHVLGHSLYYGLERRDDRPGTFVESGGNPPLKGLLSRGRPTLVVYPLNPGRRDAAWEDPAWWRELLEVLRGSFALVGVGARDYGELAPCLDAALPMDHPDSTLGNLAWLFQNAAGFIGRDGGLCHLASAVNRNLVVVWDSMLSFRHWADSNAVHLVFSNPYAFRYPQTCRPDWEELQRLVSALEGMPLPGELAQVAAGVREGDRSVRSETGFKTLLDLVASVLEAQADWQGVRGWMDQPESRRRFYHQSQEAARRALCGEARRNWVAPVFP